MLESIKRAFTQNVLDQALKHYGLSSTSCHMLGGFENISYTCQLDETFYIMRFVHSQHRRYQEVLAEIEFINRLAKHQVPVSHIRPSLRGAHAEMCLSNDGYFTVTLSEKNHGHFLEVPMKDPEKIKQLGALVGHMHHAVMHVKPKHKRKRFDKTVSLHQIKPFLEKDDLPIINIYKNTLKSLHAIKKKPHLYSLIHNDLHQHNMFDTGKAIIPIDFDDSVYHFFLSDIAMIVFYHVMFLHIPHHIEDILSTFLNVFLKGYITYHPFDKDMLKHLQLMIQFRQLQLYFVLISSGERHKYEAFFTLHTPYITGEKRLFDLDKLLRMIDVS